MPTPPKALLEQLGLSAREVDVYLASLRLGEASVGDVAHAVKLPRTTTSSVLDRLVQEGFLSAHVRRGKKIYWIEDPHLVADKYRARLEVAEALSARLHAEYHSADKKPATEIAETPEAITNLIVKAIQEIPNGGEMLTVDVPSAKHYQAVMSDELFEALSKQKVARGIRTRSLIPAGEQSHVRAESLAHNIQVRVMPEGLRFETSLWVFGNSAVLFSGTHSFAVRIAHRHTHESFASLFSFLWSQSAPLPSAKQKRPA